MNIKIIPYIFLMSVLMLMCSNIYGQQGVQYTQYMYDGSFINPAFVGTDGALSISAIHRDQWSGVKGAPQSQTLVAHTLFKKPQIGTGLYIHRESIGATRTIQATMNFAYHLKTGKSSTISFGIRAGALNLQSDFQSLQNGASDPTAIDQAFSGNNLSAGFGFLFRNQFLQVGYSIPSIVQNTLNISDSVSLDPISLTHLLFTQFELPIDHNFKLHPGFLLKYFDGIPLNYDLNLLGSYKGLIFLGASYRKSESIDLLMKLNITPQLQIAYAYDYPIGRLNNFSQGSNELLIRYIFKFQYENIAAP